MLTSTKCIELFGDPRKELDMVLWKLPEDLIFDNLPRKIYLNKRLINPLSQALHEIKIKGLEDQIKTYDGCFNIRNMKAGNRYSLHSWGIAIDINAAWNGYSKIPTMSKELVECFTNNGFDWGGEWKIPDGMHFQLKEEMIKV